MRTDPRRVRSTASEGYSVEILLIIVVHGPPGTSLLRPQTIVRGKRYWINKQDIWGADSLARNQIRIDASLTNVR
jgi:hypothetical protein